MLTRCLFITLIHLPFASFTSTNSTDIDYICTNKSTIQKIPHLAETLNIQPYHIEPERNRQISPQFKHLKDIVNKWLYF